MKNLPDDGNLHLYLKSTHNAQQTVYSYFLKFCVYSNSTQTDLQEQTINPPLFKNSMRFSYIQLVT